MPLADTLSRAYINNTQSRESEFESVNAVNYLPMHAERITDIRMKTQEDPILSTLKTTISFFFFLFKETLQGNPLVFRRKFFNQLDEVALTDGLSFRGEYLIIIPKELRKSILSELHVGHNGID